MKGRAVTILGATAWLTTVTSVMALIFNYSVSPGRAGSPPLHWPDQSRLQRDATKPTLLVFMHPRCPCSRAALGELELLVARCHGRANVHILFLKPAATTEGWEKTDLWRKASTVPDVALHSDIGGSEAAVFRSETSGQTLLYSRGGRLIFQGGITIARGHSGDNPGRDALVTLLEQDNSAYNFEHEGRGQARVGQKAFGHGPSSSPSSSFVLESPPIGTPVFGCPLFDPACRKGDARCQN